MRSNSSFSREEGDGEEEGGKTGGLLAERVPRGQLHGYESSQRVTAQSQGSADGQPGVKEQSRRHRLQSPLAGQTHYQFPIELGFAWGAAIS